MNYGRIHRGPMSDDNYTQLANAILRSPELSGNAVKIFGILASHRDGYGVTVPQLVKLMKCGTDAVSAALKELERFGLLERTRERRPDGTLGKGTDYFITDTKFLAREQEKNRRSEPKRENPVLAVTSGNAEESGTGDDESAEDSGTHHKPAGQNLNGKTPEQANPGTKKNNLFKKNNNLSVRPERNAGASAEPDRTDGRTDNPSTPETSTETTSVPGLDLEPTGAELAAESVGDSAASVLLAEAEIAAHLARVDMRPEQWRRLETAVDAALLRFSTARVARYLRDKARDAQTAMYVVRAFELYADAIVLVGEPHTTAARRTDAKLLEDLATADTPAPERPRCPEHPNSGRRAGGECSACFAAQFA
ncbi:helix-turn-helix domain-containing protein [Nocardia sp. NPDC051750]|uniref:helix-turn-helix domain-containing protein n=1 Tax=Nocardia sp. NPDC051750 TaxID=3364325 RepID=UPI0037BDDDBC